MILSRKNITQKEFISLLEQIENMTNNEFLCLVQKTHEHIIRDNKKPSPDVAILIYTLLDAAHRIDKLQDSNNYYRHIKNKKANKND